MIATTTTDAEGAYEIGNLIPGSYLVLAGPTADGAFAYSYIDELIVAAQSTTVGNTALPRAASLSGTVLSSDQDPTPAAGANVALSLEPQGRRLGLHATTDANGAFSFSGMTAGTYRVSAYTTSTDMLETSQMVKAGQDLTGLEYQLLPPATIGGRVTASTDFSIGLPGIRVARNGESTVSDADGYWSMTDNQIATAQVMFDDPSGIYLTQWWDGAKTQSAGRYARLTLGQQLTGIDAHMVIGASISGRVLSAATGAPYAGVTVSAGTARTVTDAAGKYSVGPLDTGNYDVVVSPDKSHVYKVVKNVPVRAGVATTGIDVTLNRTVSITGRVSIEAPATISPSQVKVMLSPVVRWTRPDASGAYRFDYLNGGDYQVKFIPEDTSAYFTTWWKDALRMESATNIKLALNQEPEIVDAVIPHRTHPDASRVTGADRFAVSARVAGRAFPSGSAPVVYVVTGESFPDALSAGSAAVYEGGPLLLTQKNSLPTSVRSQILSLSPKKIVVVGGPNTVSDAVVKQLKSIQPNTVRIGGADRYEASRNLARYAFENFGSKLAYVATGANFPDALTASGAAGNQSAPVILINGASNTLDTETALLLKELGVERIVIAGGPASVSPKIENALAAIAPVDRQGGADRYEAAVNINLDAYTSSAQAFLVTGQNFPDALSGSAWAGRIAAPLYVSSRDCVPLSVLAAFEQQGVKTVTLIGGENSLSAAVLDLTACPSQ